MHIPKLTGPLESSLIGRKVKLKISIIEYPSGRKYERYEVDDPQFVADAKAEHGDGVTIMPPGTASDGSVRLGRVRIWIQKNGKVDSVVRG